MIGISVEYVAYRPLRNASRLAALITAIGVSIFLANAAMLIWSPDPQIYDRNEIPDLLKVIPSHRDAEGNIIYFKPDEMSVGEALQKTHKLRIYKGNRGVYL